MPLHKAGKLMLDLVMTVLLVVTMASRVTGTAVHEWLGIALLMLFILHSVVNRRWYITLLKCRYNYLRLLLTAVNILLLAAIIALAVSGMMISQAVLGLALPYGQMARQIHSLSAHWALILVGVHLGLHWSSVSAVLRRAFKLNRSKPIPEIVFGLLTVVIIAGGVRASFARDVGAKLMMRFSFSFWDPAQGALLFMLDYFLIMALYVCLTCNIINILLKWRRTRAGSVSS